MFYIFMIWNKRGDKTIRIYDNKENVFFDTNDCEVSIEEDVGIESFLEKAKKLVKDKPTVTVYNTYSNKSSNVFAPASQVTPYKSDKNDKKEEEKEKKKEEKGKKKGKRKTEDPYDKYEFRDDDREWWRMFSHDCY